MAKKYTIKLTKGDNAYATIKLVADGISIFTANNVPINKDIMYDIWKKGIDIEIEDRDAYNQSLENNRKNKAQQKRIREMKSDAYEYLGDYLVKNNYIKQYIQIKKASHNWSDKYPYTIGFDVNLYTLTEAYAYEYLTQNKCKSCINLNPRRRSDNFYIDTNILDDIAKNINQIMSNNLYQPFYNKFDMIQEKQLKKYQGERYNVQMV